MCVDAISVQHVIEGVVLPVSLEIYRLIGSGISRGTPPRLWLVQLQLLRRENDP